MTRPAVILCSVLALLTGCASGRRSALLLERPAVGPIEESPAVGVKRAGWTLSPTPQTLTQEGVEVFVSHASPEFLNKFYRNRAIFGAYATGNPFYAENLVFYVKIANRGTERIRINPADFVLLDDRGSQYDPLTVDYITALAESRAPVASATRGVLSEARPGYFGLSVPVGKMLGGGSPHQGRYALITQSSIQAGYLYPGVVHDGIVAFWNPSGQAKELRLLIANIKFKFNAMDEPQDAMEFTFPFAVGAP